MKCKHYYNLAFFIFFIVFFIIMPWAGDILNIKIIVKEIKQNFSGIVIDKYSPRDTPPTFLKIQTDNEVLDLSVHSFIIDSAKIGDSVFKYENDNYIYLIKKENGDTIKGYYVRISNETRQSKYFPKEWKDKWPEASAWDKEDE